MQAGSFSAYRAKTTAPRGVTMSQNYVQQSGIAGSADGGGEEPAEVSQQFGAQQGAGDLDQLTSLASMQPGASGFSPALQLLSLQPQGGTGSYNLGPGASAAASSARNGFAGHSVYKQSQSQSQTPSEKQLCTFFLRTGMLRAL